MNVERISRSSRLNLHKIPKFTDVMHIAARIGKAKRKRSFQKTDFRDTDGQSRRPSPWRSLLLLFDADTLLDISRNVNVWIILPPFSPLSKHYSKHCSDATQENTTKVSPLRTAT